MTDLKEKELEGIKALIDSSRNGQLHARNLLAQRLKNLGFSLYSEHRYPHPTEEDVKVYIHIQDCYGFGPLGQKENDYKGFYQVEVQWAMPHECNEHCDFNCEEELDAYSRPATAEEVIEVLKTELTAILKEEEDELQRNWELAKALPSKEELTKIRRRIEEHLRNNRKDIPAVAKLLKII